MAKKEVLRRCVVTNQHLDKSQLIRIVKNKAGEVFIDLTNKANGHGAYISKDKDAIDKAKKHHLLDRALKTQVADEIYNELYELTK